MKGLLVHLGTEKNGIRYLFLLKTLGGSPLSGRDERKEFDFYFAGHIDILYFTPWIGRENL